MKVLVLSENELIETMRAGRPLPSCCISIRNPDQTMPEEIRKSFASVLELKFYDANSVEHLGPRQALKTAFEIAPPKYQGE
jgi:hypothetical protein